MITTTKPEEKLVSNYIPLMYLEGVDENGKVSLRPNDRLPV